MMYIIVYHLDNPDNPLNYVVRDKTVTQSILELYEYVRFVQGVDITPRIILVYDLKNGVEL